MNIAIIPARGDSKRLPGKNIKNLMGKPLIAWTIEAALESNIFDYVIVSTDSEKIATVAKKYGAKVPFIRPKHLATDEATTDAVIQHSIEWLEKEYQKKIRTVAILQPTSPLRNSQHINEAMDLFKRKKAKAVISICELEYPLEFCNTLGHNGSMNKFIKSKNLKRTQELESYYRLNGAIYIVKRECVDNLKNIYDKDSYAYIMKRWVSIDIDTLEDFRHAEVLKMNVIE